MAGLRDVVFDAEHAGTLAAFWDAVLDGHRRRPYTDEDRALLAEHGWSEEDDPEVPLDPLQPGGIRIWFNTVPDPTPGKNRLHLDVDLTSVDELQRLLDLGASVVSEPEMHGERWWILADVEGNQFCAFPPSE
jgi:hypothetical protein